MKNSELEWFFSLLKSNTPFAFSRFNDGEMGGIMEEGFLAARGDQVIKKGLRLALIDALQHVQNNYFVGIPCKECFPKEYQSCQNLIDPEKARTQPATNLTNRNWKGFIDNIPKYLKAKKIYWVSGDDQDVKKLPFDVYSQKSIPRRDSWNHYCDIKDHVHNIDHDSVVFISCGPLARVLVKEWFEKRPDLTIVDIGSTFDPFTRNVWHRCHKGWDKTGFNETPRCNTCN